MPDSHAPREGEVDNVEGSAGLYDWGDNVETSTFEQILETDDDEEERDFSRSKVLGFFEKAETKFTQTDEALESKDLANSCEKIQHFGQKKDQEGIADEKDEVDNAEGSAGLYDWGDNVDTSTFEQILEMDDDEEERDFSRSIVLGFFEQAETTFTQIDEALESKDLAVLSSLGHFLKGSSATLGLTKVKNSCEKIQHFGQKKDQEGIADEKDEDKCLQRIQETFKILKKDYAEAVTIFRTFFGFPSVRT